MSTTTYGIYKDGKLLTEGLTLENGKVLPGGWSQYEMHHEGKRIGFMESGYPYVTANGYSIKEENEK